MKKTGIVRLGITAAVIGILAACIGQDPQRLAVFGNRVALLAVGMQKPDGGAVALSEQVQAAVARAAPTTTAATTATTPSTGGSTANVTQITLPSTGSTAPQKAADAGVVSEQKVSPGEPVAGAVAVRNRSGKVLDIAKELQIAPHITIDTKSAEPQVLIVHTHTTEGYLTYDTGFYNPADVQRTKDHTKNICAAGEAIAATLRAAGFATVHDTTIHDYPKYTGAYTRSEATVKAALSRYPSVKIVLDIHRDALLPNTTTHVKPTVTVNGKKAAQMMIIAGVVSTDSIPHPHWQENFHFALRLQQALASRYSGLMRPLSLVGSRYNQHLANGYLLVEVGSDVNTVSEAVYSGELLGKTLAELMKNGFAV